MSTKSTAPPAVGSPAIVSVLWGPSLTLHFIFSLGAVVGIEPFGSFRTKNLVGIG